MHRPSAKLQPCLAFVFVTSRPSGHNGIVSQRLIAIFHADLFNATLSTGYAYIRKNAQDPKLSLTKAKMDFVQIRL